MNRTARLPGDILVPLLLLLGATIIFWVSDLDLYLTGRFFNNTSGWHHGEWPLWAWLYRFGTVPAQVVAYGALAVFLLSWRRRVKAYRMAALFLVIAMLTGPGLLVNTIFKQNWGRPRPLDLRQYSGDREYVPVWVKSIPENGQSFPSGHAAMGFYLLTPFFIFRRRSRGWALGCLSLGVLFGLLMGWARMAQGAHFASDIVWSFGFVYLSAYLLQLLLKPGEHHAPR